jgi:DNA mismatch repair protein MutS2
MSSTGLNEVFNHIQTYCKTISGQQSLQDLKPFENPQKAKKHVQKVLDLKNLITKEGFNFSLLGLDAGLNWLRKVKKNQTLQILELSDIRLFLEDIFDLRALFKNYTHYKVVENYLNRLIDPEDILSYIQIVVSNTGEINSDASEDLYKMFQDKKNLNQQVQNLLKKIVKDQDLENILQDRFVTTREGRMVLPVISGMRHDFQGIIHDSSQSKQTVFMEPQEVVPVNNKISELESKIQAEIEKILREISHFIFLKFEQLEKAYETLVEIDALYAMGYFASLADLKDFTWSEEPKMYLPDLKHPMLQVESLEKELEKKKLSSSLAPTGERSSPSVGLAGTFPSAGGSQANAPSTASGGIVGNTVELDAKNRILLLSGPNAGGKTVLLKAIGLACQMATYGLPICSLDSAELPYIKQVFVSLGDEQNLEENLSSFGGHLVKLNEASKLKGYETLILIDEICGTTEAQEGSALARAFIEEFRSNSVFAVITSHLAPLRSHWSDGVINGSMQYSPETQAPTYTFIMGLAGESMALPTARRYGVSPTIIQRALSHLTPEAQKKFSGLEEIETLKSKLIDLQSQYQIKLKDIEKREQQIALEKAKLDELKTVKLTEDLNEYQKKIEDLIKYDSIKSNFENKKNLEAIKQQMPKILKYKNQGETEITQENFETKFPPGTAVFVKSLNRKGVVQSKINSKGEVTVLSESMRVQIKFTDILPLANSGANVKNKIIPSVTSSQSGSATAHDMTQKTIDLRGQSVDEALDTLDLELDQAVQRGLLKLKIIHGHGDQDKLKKSIRTFLSRNTFIKSWLSGKAYNESDGVTIAEILS